MAQGDEDDNASDKEIVANAKKMMIENLKTRIDLSIRRKETEEREQANRGLPVKQ